MNTLYQDFKERFGIEGLVIMAATTAVGACIGLGIGTAIVMNLKPAIIVLDTNNKEGN